MTLNHCQPYNNTKAKYLFLIAVTSLIIIAPINKIIAAPILPDFQPIIQTSGVKVYNKSGTNNKLEFVTIVNIKKARLANLIGELSYSHTPKANPSHHRSKIKKKLLTHFWQDAVQQNTTSNQAKVVLNGAFFSTKNDPTGIAFGLKVNGNLITYGYGVGNEYFGQIRTFSWHNQSNIAKIQTYMVQTFKIVQDVVGGLDITANKSANKYLPRTFVGVGDRDGDGVTETVMFYSSNYARQIDASATLRGFGAKATMMLDGGGSTGIIVDGKPLISTNRPIPHALAIYAGE
ncbi:MAG: phosphodiester glycosidase family protein [Calothrix sp. MO_167.B42]|nr:phosphodiester glycosidase family protein [Calothrix sp. MO_167.B42]